MKRRHHNRLEHLGLRFTTIRVTTTQSKAAALTVFSDEEPDELERLAIIMDDSSASPQDCLSEGERCWLDGIAVRTRTS